MLDVLRERCRYGWVHVAFGRLSAKPKLCRGHGSHSVGTAGPAVVDAMTGGTCRSLRLRKAVATTPKTNRFPAASVHSRPWTPKWWNILPSSQIIDAIGIWLMAVKAPYQVLTSLMSGPRTSSISAT